MLLFTKRAVLNGAYYLFVGAMIFFLSGCASSWSAKVSSYQKWPENVVGERYQIATEPQQVGNLEYESISDTVRAAIGATGLVEGGDSARFTVKINYGSELKEDWAHRYSDPYFDGFGPYGAFGPWGGYFGHFGGFGGGVYYTPRVVTVPVQYHEYYLTVLITDAQQGGAEVYRSTAASSSGGNSLLDVMSKLAQAVFDGFPGNNGEVRTVNLPRNR